MRNPTDVLETLPSTNLLKRFAAWVASGIAHYAFSLRVEGLENLPQHEPFIICANHSSHLDTFVAAVALGKLGEKAVYMAASDYFFDHPVRNFIYRQIISLIPFDRSGTVSATQRNLDYIKLCRDQGRVVIIYPEGTRTRDGKLGDFKRGVAFFARKSGLKVVPCGIQGTYEALPASRLFPRFHPLRASFGKPLSIQSIETALNSSSAHKRGDLYDVFTQQLRTEVEGLLDANGRVSKSGKN